MKFKATRSCALMAVALLAPPIAVAAPPSQLTILRACADADTPAQCEKVIEAEQIRQFPAIASRQGGTLRLKSKDGPAVELRDQGTPGTDERAGFRLHAFWDYWFLRNAAVVSVSAHAGDHYLLVDLTRGTQTKVAAEPMLAPDGNRFVVVDLCDTQCGNAIELWRFDRDRIVRERTFRPAEKWFDADVKWKDDTSLEIEYSVRAPGQTSGEGEPVLVRARPQLLRLSDRAWRVDEAPR
jgi:hypothetical protein